MWLLDEWVSKTAALMANSWSAGIGISKEVQRRKIRTGACGSSHVEWSLRPTRQGLEQHIGHNVLVNRTLWFQCVTNPVPKTQSVLHTDFNNTGNRATIQVAESPLKKTCVSLSCQPQQRWRSKWKSTNRTSNLDSEQPSQPPYWLNIFDQWELFISLRLTSFLRIPFVTFRIFSRLHAECEASKYFSIA